MSKGFKFTGDQPLSAEYYDPNGDQTNIVSIDQFDDMFKAGNQGVFTETSTDGLSSVLEKIEQVNNDKPSATSEFNPNDTNNTPAKPNNNSSRTGYYVILDSEFGMRNSLPTRIYPLVFGKLRKAIHKYSSKIPVVFDLKEANRIAGRLIDMAVKQGTAGNKQYPVFGAIILSMDLSNVSAEERDDSGDMNMNMNKYEELVQDSADLVLYNVNGVERGLLSKNVLPNLQILPEMYVKKLDMPTNVGFALLNFNQNLTKGDILLLKKLFDSKDNFQSGGNDEAEYQAYIHAKRNYLRLKAQSVNSNKMIGGSQKNNEDNDRLMYLQEKSRYLQLKEIAKRRGLI